MFRKAFFLLSVLALLLAACSAKPTPAVSTATATAAPTQAPTATPLPPTATPLPPTTTPAPTPTATKVTWKLNDPKTWPVIAYPQGKEPEPQNKVIYDDTGIVRIPAYYIANPQVVQYFIKRTQEYLLTRQGPGHGKKWVVDPAFRKQFFSEFIIPGSPEEKDMVENVLGFLNKHGLYMEEELAPNDPHYAYFWEAWFLYRPASGPVKEVPFTVVVRWVQKPVHNYYYRVKDDSLEHTSFMADPAEYFLLWRLDKDGHWKIWSGYGGWLKAPEPKPAVYDPRK